MLGWAASSLTDTDWESIAYPYIPLNIILWQRISKSKSNLFHRMLSLSKIKLKLLCEFQKGVYTRAFHFSHFQSCSLQTACRWCLSTVFSNGSAQKTNQARFGHLQGVRCRHAHGTNVLTLLILKKLWHEKTYLANFWRPLCGQTAEITINTLTNTWLLNLWLQFYKSPRKNTLYRSTIWIYTKKNKNQNKKT